MPTCARSADAHTHLPSSVTGSLLAAGGGHPPARQREGVGSTPPENPARQCRSRYSYLSVKKEAKNKIHVPCIPVYKAPVGPGCCSYRAQLRHVRSPLTDRLLAWRRALGGHPDGAFARYVIEKGYRIGYDYSTPLRASARNMQSAGLHPGVITQSSSPRGVC